MKYFFTSTISLLIFLAANCQVKLPASSPTQTIRQDFGLGSIEITYSRPGLKGRKVFGDLVPTGRVWRTGANAATRISFTDNVEIGGKKIEPGTYALYTIPSEDSWDIILNTGIHNWGTEGYKEAEDVLRVKVIPVKNKNLVETFSMQFCNITPESCDLEINWEKTTATVHISTDIKEKMRQQIDSAMTSEKKPYWEAAQFYKEYDHNLSKALENINMAVAENNKAYWMYLYKANIQKELGDNAGALESSRTSLALAKEAGNADYVKMNQVLQKALRE